MEIGDIRGVITAVLLALFVGVCAWAWSRQRNRDFEEAARLPLDEDPAAPKRAALRRDNEEHPT